MNNTELQARINGVRAADGGAHLLVEVVFLENGERRRETLTLLTARVGQMPQVGEISPGTLDDLRRESCVCAAIGAGLRCLGAGGSSARRLVEKLRTRGFDFDTATAATEVLAEKGYLREEESALREAERGMAKLWGDRRILADLSAKGYSGSALQYAKARLQAEDGVERCVKLLRKRRVKFPADESEARKLFAALVRYGYTPTEIKKALQK